MTKRRTMAGKSRSPIVVSVTLWMCCFLTRIEAWIPPHPNSTIPWESVHDMRRRLDLEPFNYTPSRFMDHELCRYLTEDECEESDIRMQEHIAAHRSLQVQVRENPNSGAINVGYSFLPVSWYDNHFPQLFAILYYLCSNRFWF
jgi:hypothetical protein